MGEKNVKQTKKRYWAFVLYPESAPADWREQIAMTGLQGEISPLHDKDINPTGEPKKPHYHVILAYGNPTTYSNVKSLTDRLCQPIPIPLDSIQGMHRYLTHQDNPEKYQYDSREIVPFGGFNIMDFVELSQAEKLQLKMAVMQMIRELDIQEYADLLEILADSQMLAELDIAMCNTMLYRGYIESRRFKHAGKDSKPQLTTIVGGK